MWAKQTKNNGNKCKQVRWHITSCILLKPVNWVFRSFLWFSYIVSFTWIILNMFDAVCVTVYASTVGTPSPAVKNTAGGTPWPRRFLRRWVHYKLHYYRISIMIYRRCWTAPWHYLKVDWHRKLEFRAWSMQFNWNFSLLSSTKLI
jgi:hypothetical protein